MQMLRLATLSMLLLCAGCPQWVKAVGSIAVAVKDVCDALDGGRSAVTFGPPPPKCLPR